MPTGFKIRFETAGSEDDMLNNLALEHWPTERLVEYARNPRKNDAVVDRMCAAIREFGFRIPIVARSDGSVVDGHLRLKAARQLKLETVPVVLADDLSEAQIKAFRLLANRSASWAEWDEELLAIELSELQDANFDLDLTGFDDAELDRLLVLGSASSKGARTAGGSELSARPRAAGFRAPTLITEGPGWIAQAIGQRRNRQVACCSNG